MKRLFLFLAVFVAFVTANAQLVQVGLTGDAAFLKKEGGKYLDGSNVDTDMGWSAGVKVKVSSAMGLGADAGLKFGKEDNAYYAVGGSAESSTALSLEKKLTYVSLPVNARYDLKLPGIAKVLAPYAFAGPEFRYNVDGFDLKSINKDHTTKDFLKENKLGWNLNFGFGVILFKHLELSYQYSIRKTDPLELKDTSVFKDIESRYKSKTNKIGVTVYF